MTYIQYAKPFLKWVGGKRQLLSDIKKYIPAHYSTYYEPFVGGGALLFELQPHQAVINDVNIELINLYEVIRDDVEALIASLKQHKNDSSFFYEVRGWDRDPAKYNSLDRIERASRIHYLNKTCYNGLFRVNKAGQFNTPFGRYKNPNITNEVNLRAVSHYLNQADIKILCTDYATALQGIDQEAFVYLDPPYDPVSESASFTGYAKEGYNQEEQIRLKHVCDTLNERGIRFLLSNSATPFIRELYHDYHQVTVGANRTINSVADKRGTIDEVLVMNYQ
jgi:DNA adenine methylase